MIVSKHLVTGFFAVAALLLVAQASSAQEGVSLPKFSTSDIMSQCGNKDDLQHIEFYDGTLGVSKDYAKRFESTTVQLQWKSQAEITSLLPDHLPGNVATARWCTGTLISEKLIVTAGHCFDMQDGSSGWVSPFKMQSGKKVYAEPKVLGRLMVVNFGYQKDAATGQLRIPEVYSIKEVVEHRNGGLDYAVFEIAPDSAGKYPAMAPAVVDVRAAKKDESIAIMQHPHGEPKMIEAGHIQSASSEILKYDDLDTWGGSSGSGIRDADGDVIGVHTNGGCETNANFGVSLMAVSKVSDVF